MVSFWQITVNERIRMEKLKNKVAVITGGNSGMGLATEKLFAAEGAKVAITGRNEATIKKSRFRNRA